MSIEKSQNDVDVVDNVDDAVIDARVRITKTRTRCTQAFQVNLNAIKVMFLDGSENLIDAIVP